MSLSFCLRASENRIILILLQRWKKINFVWWSNTINWRWKNSCGNQSKAEQAIGGLCTVAWNNLQMVSIFSICGTMCTENAERSGCPKQVTIQEMVDKINGMLMDDRAWDCQGCWYLKCSGTQYFEKIFGHEKAIHTMSAVFALYSLRTKNEHVWQIQTIAWIRSSTMRRSFWVAS